MDQSTNGSKYIWIKVQMDQTTNGSMYKLINAQMDHCIVQMDHSTKWIIVQMEEPTKWIDVQNGSKINMEPSPNTFLNYAPFLNVCIL